MILVLLFQLLFGVTILDKDIEFKMSDKRNKVKSFLKTISKVESSGGKNFKHPTMKAGIHKGNAAIGRYGLMPNTVNEVLNRLKRAGSLTPDLEKLKELDAASLKSHLETNPHVEDQIAEALAQKVLDRQQDEEKAAYSWNQGHNLSPERIAGSSYQKADYVKRYNEYKKLEGDENE